MSNTKIIIKNTLFLYCRQFLVLFVALFTTRIVIQTLGVEDYGIYNLIAGIITMLSIVTASMTSATQRFLAMSLGNEGKEAFDSIYDVCCTFFLILSLVVLIIGETIGIWTINSYLDIPSDRLIASNWCYQTALLSFILGMLRVPSNAAIIAYEKMDFYAYISVFEVMLNLGVAYLLYVVPYDPLITYSLLLLSTAILVNIIYNIYAFNKLNVRIHGLSLDPRYVKSIFAFSFWTFFGSVATIGSRQGMNIIINKFFGVRLNAASAIATKVGGNAYDFVSNFTTAYRPQIFKLYASENKTELYKLIYRTTKLSCFLFIIIMIPLNLTLDNLLPLWLGEVPEYASIFCRLLMIYLAIDALQSPLFALVSAIGNIKRFQLTFSFILMINIPVMWLLMRSGFAASYIYITYIAFNVISSIYRTIYVKNKSDIDIKRYITCVARILLTTILAYYIGYLLLSIYGEINGWGSLLLFVVSNVILTVVIILMIGTDKEERIFLYGIIKNRMSNLIK